MSVRSAGVPTKGGDDTRAAIDMTIFLLPPPILVWKFTVGASARRALG